MKAFRWFPFALLMLVLDWWQLALGAVGAVTVVATLLLKSLGAGLLFGLGSVGVVLALWLVSAAWLAWKDRDKNWKMF